MAGDLTDRKFLDYEKERAKNRTLGDTLTGVSCFSVEMKYYLPGGSKPDENSADMAVSQEKCKLRPKKWNFGWKTGTEKKKLGRVYKDCLKPLNVSFAPYHYGLSYYIII